MSNNLDENKSDKISQKKFQPCASNFSIALLNRYFKLLNFYKMEKDKNGWKWKVNERLGQYEVKFFMHQR